MKNMKQICHISLVPIHNKDYLYMFGLGLVSGGFWREIFISDGVNMCRQNWFRHSEENYKKTIKKLLLVWLLSYKRFSIYLKKLRKLYHISYSHSAGNSFAPQNFLWSYKLEGNVRRCCWLHTFMNFFQKWHAFFQAVCKGVPILVQHIIRKWRFCSTRGTSFNPSYTWKGTS